MQGKFSLTENYVHLRNSKRMTEYPELSTPLLKRVHDNLGILLSVLLEFHNNEGFKQDLDRFRDFDRELVIEWKDPEKLLVTGIDKRYSSSFIRREESNILEQLRKEQRFIPGTTRKDLLKLVKIFEKELRISQKGCSEAELKRNDKNKRELSEIKYITTINTREREFGKVWRKRKDIGEDKEFQELICLSPRSGNSESGGKFWQLTFKLKGQYLGQENINYFLEKFRQWCGCDREHIKNTSYPEKETEYSAPGIYITLEVPENSDSFKLNVSAWTVKNINIDGYVSSQNNYYEKIKLNFEISSPEELKKDILSIVDSGIKKNCSV